MNRHRGLFYFDSAFRPVPLEQHFIGVKGKPSSPQSRRNLDQVTFEKVSELVHEGHQVMVFVHARKETVKTALALKEAAQTEGSLDEFSCQDHPQFEFFRRDIGTSRNKEMKQLFDSGFGIHNAGMLRTDRNMMERMFEARAIKVAASITGHHGSLIVVAGPMLHSDIGVGCQPSGSRRYARLSIFFWAALTLSLQSSSRARRFTTQQRVPSWICPYWTCYKSLVAPVAREWKPVVLDTFVRQRTSCSTTSTRSFLRFVGIA